MLRIDNMRIKMPRGYEARAADITRLAGEILSTEEFKQDRFVQHLDVGPLRVSPLSSDRDIAQAVADNILTALRRI